MSPADQRSEKAIRSLLRTVRRRWRLRLLLRGLAWTAGLTLAVAFLASAALEPMRFEAQAVTWARILTWGTLLVTAGWTLVRPLLRRVDDTKVALYLEEHEPSLDHTVVSALDAGGREDLSPALAARLREIAVERARRVDFGKRVEQSGLYRMGGALTAVAVVGLTVLLTGPDHLRTGLSALLVPTTDAASVNPYAVSVVPGDVTIARGTDQLVTAALQGFEAGEASIFTRTGPDASFRRLSMIPSTKAEGGFEALLLGVEDRTEYFVESTGVRSPTYTVEVADLPYVGQLDLTYRYPSYTGMAPRTVEDGGDVAALPGTEVEVTILPTVPAPSGRLLVDGEPVTLSVDEGGILTGSFTVGTEGFYSVELARETGELVPASPEYTIDVLEDQPPLVRFSEPGRDVPASPIEEVFLEISADDDYGVGDIRLVYSVNGGAEDTVPVFRQSGSPLPEVTAGHTLFLEEYLLEPGDLVSYYALVRDNRSVAGGEPVVSDMFFLNIRPFERAYREGQQQGGGAAQGGGAQPPESALSELQRQVISATFNLIRQRDSYSDSEFSENVRSVSLTQGRLRDQVETLLQRMMNRGLTETDPGFRDVSAVLPLAGEAMDTARTFLDEEALQEAIPQEQAALRYLQQAEETFERYVTQQNQQGGGGGGGGQSANADDLADLFELELDKLQNQYETVRRGEQQSTDEEVDELLEELRELARRQEQEAERMRRRAQAGQTGGQGGSASQRELAEQAEEAARQLARLARETNDEQLNQTARDLQEAAESMRRAAADGGASGQSQSESARRRLEDARRGLEDARSARARRDAESAIERVEELTQQQRDVQREVRSLPETGEARRDQLRRLRERKDQMTDAVQQLEQQLDQAAQSARGEHPEAGRALQEAANQIREEKIKEKLQYSRGTIEQWDAESANTLEMNIEADLRNLQEQLERARAAAGEATSDPLRDALDDTRELVRGMEAMDRRLRESGQASPGEGSSPGEAPVESGEGQPGEAQGGEEGQGQEGQGQEGEGGGQGQGEPAGGPSGGEAGQARATGGPPSGGATRGNPRALGPEEIRQYTRELQERGEQVRALRDGLRQAGRPVEELQAVLEAMNRLERDGIWDDPAEVAGLNDEIVEMLKRLEFGLRREVEGETERRATLTGSDEVPPGYRELVEEYYRALARGGGGG